MNFEYHIYQYLLKHSKAEVPDFGIFELTKESAKIDAENSIIIPPKEVITFQYQPLVSDNHLTHYVSKETNSDIFTVQENLKNEVSKWHQKLKLQNILTLENLGQFQLENQNHIIRINENDDDVFGLEAINIKALKNPSVKFTTDSEEYSFNKNVIWTFLAIILTGIISIFLFGNQELIFGKSSQIPTKKIIKKAEPKTPAIPKQDSIKKDSIKPIKNAHIQKINR